MILKTFRDKVLIPFTIPVAAILVILIGVLNFSVILLSLEERASRTLATVVAMLTATAVLIGAAYFSRGQDGSSRSLTALATIGLVLVLGGSVGAEALEEAREAQAQPSDLGPPDITVTAGPGLAFQEKLLRSRPGRIVVQYVNADTVPHTFLFDGIDGFKLKVNAKGEVAKGAVKLDPGNYLYYCDVPGHEAAGMIGFLMVTEPTGEAPGDGAGR
ncbi:MAG: cupredoxin domain-containing protein [Actinomycetota bacterium]